jgi:hypothetical protein
LVRIIFVLLTVLTHGLGILIYLVLMIVVPKAESSAQKARAYGQPFTAQELVDRARQEYSKFADKGEWRKWKHEFRQQMRQERQKWRQERREQRAQTHGRCHSPFMGIFTVALVCLWVWGLVTLFSKGMVFGLIVPASIPLWVALLIWLCLYGFVMASIHGARCSVNYRNDGQEIHYHHHNGFFETIIWLAFMVLVVWFLWRYVPAAHPMLLKAQLWFNHVWARINSR